MDPNKQTQVFRRCSLAIASQAYSDDGSRPVIVGVGTFEKISIQAVDTGSSAWSTAVVTVRVSNRPNGPWLSIPACSVTMTAPGIVGPIDVTPYQFVALEVTTAQSSTSADFYICAWGTKN